MTSGNATRAVSEDEFAGLVNLLAADPVGSAQLTDLLREEHPVYDGRGTATVVRMRGWVLLALARSGLSDQALIFVLEELDTGIDAYLVAAAARALRSYAQPNETLAPFVVRALNQIRYHDEPMSFESGPPTAFRHAAVACRKAEISRSERRVLALSPNRSTPSCCRIKTGNR